MLAVNRGTSFHSTWTLHATELSKFLHVHRNTAQHTLPDNITGTEERNTLLPTEHDLHFPLLPHKFNLNWI